MGLKNLEKEILKNDNVYRNLTKQVKLITTILDKVLIYIEIIFSTINLKPKN